MGIVKKLTCVPNGGSIFENVLMIFSTIFLTTRLPDIDN